MFLEILAKSTEIALASTWNKNTNKHELRCGDTINISSLLKACLVSGFVRGVNEIFALLGFYAV
jgi:hypothetical protein